MSKAIDHWGYYNGETGNDSQNDLIPQSTSITTLIGGYNLSHGSALRDTDEAEMIKGSLQRITYPTKGYTEYTYEANSHTALFASFGLTPLTSSQGRHLVYRRVVELLNGNGYKEYFMDIETYTSNQIPKYPAKPGVFLIRNGALLESNVFKQNDAKEASEIIEGYNTDIYAQMPGACYAAAEIVEFNGSSTSNRDLFSEYAPRTGIFRPEKITKTLDNVTTETDYIYDLFGKILSPVRTSFTNSDGTVYENYVEYLVNYALDTDIKTNMINRHMIGIPYYTRLFVGSDMIDGQTTVYSHYTSSGHQTSSESSIHFPRPYYNQRFERTWTNGVLQSGAWSIKEWFFQYNTDGLLYRYQKEGWSQTYYYYNSDKLLERKTYETHETEYDYYTNSTLLEEMTNVDGTTSSYTYDGLMRLKTESDDCNNITTTYSYHTTSNLGTTKNYIETLVDYPTATDSEVNDIKTIVYKDGLGRDLQTVRYRQAPNNKDLLINTDYDNQGRVKYQYRQRQSDYNDGRYVPSSTAWHKTEYDYYDSPLNRLERSKPQSWYWTYHYYGSNSSADDVKKNGTTASYDVNTLFKKTVKDHNGRKTIVFTDKKGRTVLSRQTDDAESTSKRLDTYSLYDDKDRVT